jgi:hypothetical protein
MMRHCIIGLVHEYMKTRLLTLASFFGLLTGCGFPASTPLPTSIPPEHVPTVIALTADAANLAATETLLASLPTLAPTHTPAPTLTITPGPSPTPTSIPGHDLAEIEIGSPGPFSKVVSPITLKMDITTGKSEIVQVDLVGEDGRLITRLLKKNVPTSNNGILQTIKINFEIPGAAEVARLTVSTFDEFDRIQALNSVRLLLLSTGENEITTPGNPSEPIRIFSPTKKDVASKGVLRIRGDVWPFSTKPLILELITPDGKSLGLRIVDIEQAAPQLFETTIPYKISEPVIARLTIYQEDDRIPGVFYVYTQEVQLNP